MAARLLRVLPIFVIPLALAWLPVRPSGQTGSVSPGAERVTILGSVVDAGLAPVAGAAVTLERAARVEARTTTDGAGKFRFTNVVPAAYRVKVEHRGFPTVWRDFQVPTGVETIQVPLVLARAEDAQKARAAEERDAGNAAQAAPRPAPAVPGPPPVPVAEGATGRGGATAPTRSDGRSAYVTGGVSESVIVPEVPRDFYQPGSTESYARIDANRFQSTRNNPLSTFGADVDTASYTNVRRFLTLGQLPPRDAVRVEELVNYFRFGYVEPRGTHPIGLTTEIGDCPWAPSHKLVLIGARAKASAGREIEGRNIVLLIDVSGSMMPAPRLPLLKTAFGMFVDTLRPDDRVAIVTYAGTSGVALPSTPVRQRDVIQRAIAGLGAGGSTNGAGGIMTAYRVAREAFIPGGVNRVILATDGDFNVGITNMAELERLIERERESGVFLSVFGVGSGNVKDATMEMLADKGNGNYAYLDTLQEARRVLITDADSTLETIAKDVKFQVEFNPAVVSAWKLVGYENRLMAAAHFNDDRKDGGEMGAGHTVTVLYEVIPVGVRTAEGDDTPMRPSVDPLRYQDAQAPVARIERVQTDGSKSGEWLTVKVRYKTPEGEVSKLITQPVRSTARVEHLAFASAVAEFGLLLRDDRHDTRRWDALLRRVHALTVAPAMASDKAGFVELLGTARGMSALR